MLAGLIAAFVGGIWLLVVAFQESLAWGLGCLHLPFVGLFFIILHWDRAARPFGVNVGGRDTLQGPRSSTDRRGDRV
jgi:hypothetical protein